MFYCTLRTPASHLAIGNVKQALMIITGVVATANGYFAQGVLPATFKNVLDAIHDELVEFTESEVIAVNLDADFTKITITARGGVEILKIEYCTP